MSLLLVSYCSDANLDKNREICTSSEQKNTLFAGMYGKIGHSTKQGGFFGAVQLAMLRLCLVYQRVHLIMMSTRSYDCCPMAMGRKPNL